MIRIICAARAHIEIGMAKTGRTPPNPVIGTGETVLAIASEQP